MSSNGTYSRKTVDITEVHSNIEQRLIQITEDRLLLILNDHIDFIERRNEWVAPLGILVTLIVVFVTTDFKEAYLSADTWKAIFIVGAALTFYWLCRSIYIALKAKSVDDIVDRIKRGNS